MKGRDLPKDGPWPESLGGLTKATDRRTPRPARRQRELPLPSPERPPLPECPPLRSNVSPPGPRHPRGVHPLALRLAFVIGLRVALFLTSPALCLLKSPHLFLRLFLALLGSFLGFLGPAFGLTTPFLRFRSPPLGYAG